MTMAMPTMMMMMMAVAMLNCKNLCRYIHIHIFNTTNHTNIPHAHLAHKHRNHVRTTTHKPHLCTAFTFSTLISFVRFCAFYHNAYACIHSICVWKLIFSCKWYFINICVYNVYQAITNKWNIKWHKLVTK